MKWKYLSIEKYEKFHNNKFIKNIDFDSKGFIMCLCELLFYRVT